MFTKERVRLSYKLLGNVSATLDLWCSFFFFFWFLFFLFVFFSLDKIFFHSEPSFLRQVVEYILVLFYKYFVVSDYLLF